MIQYAFRNSNVWGDSLAEPHKQTNDLGNNYYGRGNCEKYE